MPSHRDPGTGTSADRECRKLIADHGNREALGWLQESKPKNIRTLGEQSPSESLRIAQDLYDAGAVKVLAVKIDSEPGVGETTNIVCVEMPVGLDSRQRLFKIEVQQASDAGFDPVSDDGQTYLFLYKFKLSLWQIVRMFFTH